MVAQDERVGMIFAGSKRDQELAGRLFSLLSARGRFMSVDAPIRVSLTSLNEFFERQGEADLVTRILAVVAANPAVFAIEDLADGRVIVTTRAGRAPIPRDRGLAHTFAQRFMTPLPKPDKPAPRPRERVRVDPSWSTVSTTLEELAGTEDEEPLSEVALAPAIAVPELAPAPVDILFETPPPPPARTITLPIVAPTDVTGVDDLDLARAIRERLQTDTRIANFGDQWLMEDRVPRFSRGDLRRLKEYLQEQEQPLTDDVLVQDVLGMRPGTADFELTRFAVNFRLSREHREFEFVGTSNQRFWTTSGLPPIGTQRRKPNEIGSDYRYLLDEAPAVPDYRSRASVDHALTFYEYIHGLLPYDAELQALLSPPLLPAQRSAVLTFECPQSFTTYLVELRFPTPNRGGFILGLDDFYSENLVPGAVISIARTENDGHYRVEYLAEPGQSGRLLELDERRAHRYVFRPITFGCGVDDRWLLTEEQFSRLNGDKPVDDKVRRRPEAVIAATFERVGDDREGNFSAKFDTLLAGVNIERPMSPTLLRTILENDDTGAFSRDPEEHDVYTYVPGSTP
jgi:hypothetical protein